MKISLNLGQQQQQGGQSKVEQQRALEREILGAKGGDWNSRNNLARLFMPLLHSLAEKRAKDVPTLNRLVEAGKEGLADAAHKYKTSIGPDRFRIFALDFIEKRMDRELHGGGGIGAFFARLFGKG
jgi:DNA-directed RNA polymerase specialized sigma subunit